MAHRAVQPLARNPRILLELVHEHHASALALFWIQEVHRGQAGAGAGDKRDPGAPVRTTALAYDLVRAQVLDRRDGVIARPAQCLLAGGSRYESSPSRFTTKPDR